MSKQKVKAFYGQDEHYEFNRLVADAFHRLELDTTLHFIDKFMPKTGHILDAGGGPGRYTMEMAKRGFTVSHIDLNPNYSEYTKNVMAENDLSKYLASSNEGDICDLSRFEDSTFDGVLCLGAPLSHV
ncbi:MAG TPA: class I SAM-dependent methyltransferase, partial [bacterium]|nr:class I SAM-dependent methyltransferase [bacterium]